MIPAVTSPALALPGIAHAFFTRDGGVSTGVYASLNGGRGSDDDPAAVAENRARMAAALGVAPGRFATPYQVHSAVAVDTAAAWPDAAAAPRADAVATRTRRLAVGVTVADCGPILLADAGAGVVAAAHAGWKGAFGGVIEAALAKMEALGARRADTVAVLGPCIRQPSYEVGAEFVERFAAADPANGRFFAPAARPGHALFDLGGYVVARLRAAGVGTVADLGLDTYAEPERFFSYRRTTHRGEADYGRLIAAIALVP
ncbi:MAG TPA: peptidoglycan editing factor PgeF [Hyphomicrobiales bacterium]|nr:peptidoglycan editing factor PgeF [Hyphomicrobiales bacterium]